MKKLLKNYAEKYNIKTLILVFIPFYRFNFLHYIEENRTFLKKVKKRVYTFLYLIFLQKLKSSKKYTYEIV